MYWDAEAYAEGICEHAAGSSIETLVDTIDATIDQLGQSVPIGAEDHIDDLCAKWKELRDCIARNEEENGEDTVFNDD